MAKKEIYQLKVSLKNFKPSIWRRILVASDTKLSELHFILQITMGWSNSHLHQFIKNKMYYAEKSPVDDFWDDFNNIDYKKITVSDLLEKGKDKMIYEYDFGDGWRHEIVLEKILPFDKSQPLPFCLAGKMKCPPEDCGGVWGYQEMLEVLNNPKHPEYTDYADWLGEDEFDATEFNVARVNEMLKGL